MTIRAGPAEIHNKFMLDTAVVAFAVARIAHLKTSATMCGGQSDTPSIVGGKDDKIQAGGEALFKQIYWASDLIRVMGPDFANLLEKSENYACRI